MSEDPCDQTVSWVWVCAADKKRGGSPDLGASRPPGPDVIAYSRSATKGDPDEARHHPVVLGRRAPDHPLPEPCGRGSGPLRRDFLLLRPSAPGLQLAGLPDPAEGHHRPQVRELQPVALRRSEG